MKMRLVGHSLHCPYKRLIMSSPSTEQHPADNTPQPGILFSLLPIAVLIVLMIINVSIFGDDATYGPNQIALMSASGIAVLIGMWRYKLSYHTMQTGMLRSIDQAMGSVLILFAIAALIAVWMAAGIVPTIIYYGFLIIHPAVFLPVSCITCALVSLATGSSWTTSGTIGVALVAIGQTYDIPMGMVAGAVISGAYFGDKMSPLSDTTNLAPAMCGVELFEHVKHMVYSTGPAIILAILGFMVLGFVYNGSGGTPAQVARVADFLHTQFSLGPHLLLVPLVVLILVRRKVPALPALATGVLLGIVFALLFQQNALSRFTQRTALTEALNTSAETPTSAQMEETWQKAQANDKRSLVHRNYAAMVDIMAHGFSLHSGNKEVDELLSGGGILSMLPTIWLILSAMMFGGALEAGGMLKTLANAMLRMVRSNTSLVATTVGSAIFVNATAGDQYVAIVLPARMYGDAYARRGLHPKNLSRAVEDGGTVTSVLIPWNSGGAFHAATLGVATFSYLPFCFFNLLSPLVSILIARLNWKMTPALCASETQALTPQEP